MSCTPIANIAKRNNVIFLSIIFVSTLQGYALEEIPQRGDEQKQSWNVLRDFILPRKPPWTVRMQ